MEQNKNKCVLVSGGAGYIGFTDDVAVMTFVLKMVKDSITPEIRRKADQKILDLFPDPA